MGVHEVFAGTNVYSLLDLLKKAGPNRVKSSSQQKIKVCIFRESCCCSTNYLPSTPLSWSIGLIDFIAAFTLFSYPWTFEFLFEDCGLQKCGALLEAGLCRKSPSMLCTIILHGRKKSWQGELEDLSRTPTSTILWPSAFLSHHPCHPHHSQQHQDLFRKFSTLIDVPLKTSESSLHLKPTDKRCWVFLEDYLFQETFGAVFGGWR